MEREEERGGGERESVGEEPCSSQRCRCGRGIQQGLQDTPCILNGPFPLFSIGQKDA